MFLINVISYASLLALSLTRQCIAFLRRRGVTVSESSQFGDSCHSCYLVCTVIMLHLVSLISVIQQLQSNHHGSRTSRSTRVPLLTTHNAYKRSEKSNLVKFPSFVYGCPIFHQLFSQDHCLVFLFPLFSCYSHCPSFNQWLAVVLNSSYPNRCPLLQTASIGFVCFVFLGAPSLSNQCLVSLYQYIMC